jgi:hypothetical protein
VPFDSSTEKRGEPRPKSACTTSAERLVRSPTGRPCRSLKLMKLNGLVVFATSVACPFEMVVPPPIPLIAADAAAGIASMTSRSSTNRFICD